MSQYRKDRQLAETAKKLGYINYNLAAGEKVKQCPYNEAHIIRDERWTRHLIKCRDQYKKECERNKKPMEVGICKFNSNHHIPLQDMEAHEGSCPNMAQMVDFMSYFQNIAKTGTVEKKEEKGSDVEMVSEAAGAAGGSSDFYDVMGETTVHGESVKTTREDWEKDLNRNPGSVYDPKKRMQKAAGRMVQMHHEISTKSERKKIRDEHARIFEEKYNGNVEVMNGPRLDEPQEIEVDEVAESMNMNLRVRRFEELAKAQRAAELSNAHLSNENRKRRSMQADDQITAILELARRESLQRGSETDADSSTIPESSHFTESTMSILN